MPLSPSAAWAAIARFAHARGAVPATFLWNLGQGSVVPGPAELLLVPLAAADPPKAWRLAGAAMCGSILGGCIAFWLGHAAFATVGRPLVLMLGVSEATLARAMATMAEHGWLMILGSTLSPLSTKAVAIGAGASGMSFAAFVWTLAAGRILRFSVIVLLLRASAGLLHRLRLRYLSH